jgi:hypothetical protein
MNSTPATDELAHVGEQRCGGEQRPPDGERHRSEDELIMDLERDQLVFETLRPVGRAHLSARATAALWALRVFVVVVSAMVIYTFINQLH